MSACDTEILYHPSKWTKRLPADVVVAEHIKFIQDASAEVVSRVPHTTVQYDEGVKTKLDIFGTDLPSESLVFMFVHGGYWQEKALGRENSSYVAKALYSKGIKSVIVGYDLCPEVTLEQIVQQIQKAFRYCLDYCTEHKSKGLLLAGHSAGAHLIATLFQENISAQLPQNEQSLVKAAFLIGGIYNLLPLVDIPSVNDPLKLTKQEAERLSPLLQPLNAPKTLKFFVVVAENESPAFRKQAKEFDGKLRENGGEVEYLDVAGGDHFDVAERLTETDFVLTKAVLGFNN